jgi:hypothetical protein
MKKTIFTLTMSVLFCSLFALGCDVKVKSSEEHFYNKNSKIDNSWQGVCQPYCSYLEKCEVISTQGYQKCETECRSNYEQDPEHTSEACDCALGDRTCSSLEKIDSCKGLPWPYSNG